jgi:peptidoglycan/LPS O-acetylase OafA/YrhL
LLVTMLVISPVVYGLAYLVNRFVEVPGIRVGKRIAERIGSDE